MAQRNTDDVPFGHRFMRTTDRVDTPEGRVDALATMSLMQMLADAYEDAQVIWERNKEQGGQEDDDPGSYGPNEAQKVVEDFLVWAHFMPRQERHFHPKKVGVNVERWLQVSQLFLQVETTVQPLPQPPRRKTVSTPSQRLRHYLGVIGLSARKRKRSNPCTHDADGTASPPTLSKFWKRLRTSSVTSKKSCKIRSPTCTPIVPEVASDSKIPSGEVVVAPMPYDFVRRPRFNTDLPYRKMKTLRRMNWEDTCALMAYARTARRRKIPVSPPQPFPYIIAPGLLQPTSMRHLDFEDPRSLQWPKSTPTPLHSPTPRLHESRRVPFAFPDEKSERKPVSLWTLLLITLLGYLLIFCVFVFCVLLGLWRIASLQWLFGDSSIEE